MKLAHSDRTRPRRRARGFTLPDVLICTTIVACLSAIALPSYHRTILKDRRTIARTALTDLAARQETQVLLRGAHATDVGGLVAPSETAPTEARYLGPGGTWRDRQAKDSVYRVEVLDAASSAIERMCGSGAVDGEHTPLALSATAIGPQSSDRACRQLVLCFAGRPGAKAAFDDRGRNTAAACWS